MTMTAEQLAQLREVAERANTPGNLASYSKATALMEFDALITPDITLALLDELERVTAERNALREGEMGDARHSNTRAAADIYFQLVEECEIPPGGSLVEHIDSMRERIAELECEVSFKSAHIKELQCEMKFKSACDDDGINLTVEG